jgi:hypothetical protein
MRLPPHAPAFMKANGNIRFYRFGQRLVGVFEEDGWPGFINRLVCSRFDGQPHESFQELHTPARYDLRTQQSLFPSAELRAMLAVEFEKRCGILCFGPIPTTGNAKKTSINDSGVESEESVRSYPSVARYDTTASFLHLVIDVSVVTGKQPWKR